MKIVFPACVAFGLATIALAADQKGSSKPPTHSQSEMECDHPEAKPESGSGEKKPGSVIVRGAKIERAPSVSLADLLRAPEQRDGKTVVTEGRVRRACTRMGCWMELAAGDEGPGVRVTFKDYGFFVPTDSSGATAKVQGTVKLVELSDRSAAHYQSEGARMAKDRHGKYREVQLVASGVELRR